MKYDFVVLGATGMQGRIVSKDLLKNGYSVLLCGRDKSRVLHLLKKYKKTGFEYFEVTDKTSTLKTIRNSGSNIVINCVEGDWNDKVLEMCLEAGVHSIDLGSDVPLTQKQFALDSALKKKNLIHITGCGSVPGIGNVMLRYIDSDFDKVDYEEGITKGMSNFEEFMLKNVVRHLEGKMKLTGSVTGSEMCLDLLLGKIDAVAHIVAKGVLEPPAHYLLTKELGGYATDLQGNDLKTRKWKPVGMNIDGAIFASSQEIGKSITCLLQSN